MPTQNEYNVAKQNGRIIHSKIYLLNFKLQKVDEISGLVLDGSSFSIDATSDIRRTCSISIVPTNSSFEIEHGGKIWIDKYVQIYIGIEDNKNNNEIVYTNMGIYLVNNPNRVYSAENNTLNISGLDLMSKLTGFRNGNLEGIEYQIPINSSIKGAIQSSLELAGINRYSVVEPTPTPLTPNAISIAIGGTVYDILKQLVDINANYQMYFDVMGIFYFNLIPSGYNEPIMVSDDIWKQNLIEYSMDISFENVKNTIEVFGKTQDNGVTPYGFAQDTNTQSPFCVDGTAGIIRIVLSGGEYDNISTSDLAQQRAKYELYLRCKLQDQIQLKCVPIYWLDVNWVVEITLPNKQGKEEKNLYITKKINTTLGVNGTQDITLMRYYPLYPLCDDFSHYCGEDFYSGDEIGLLL